VSRNTKPTEIDIYLNFPPLWTYFEEEAATSTTRVYIGGKPFVKPVF
jgi:hypothetical protein